MKKIQFASMSISILLMLLIAACGTKHQYDARKDMATEKRYYEEEAVEALDEGIPVEKNEGDIVEENFNTEEYDKIVENPFLAVINNPVSTFGVDVDKASYSNVRRFLNQNEMPPPDAVRLEELINYFDYSYPQPTDEHPFSVNIEMSDCPWSNTHKLLLIGLKGKETPVADIPPANLVFLLDVSGSMDSPEKLPLLKKALKILLDELRPSDKISIAVYAGAAGLVLPATEAENKREIINAFDKLQAGGSTAGGEGIELAYKVAKENFIQGGNNRVILATDGDFNIGPSSDAAMERLIEEKRKEGIFLTVLGFGMGNYKDAKMEKLSNAGNGNYAYIDNILEAKKVLGYEMWRTLYTIAKDVKMQIEFNPAVVKGYRLIGYENRTLRREDFNDDTKDAGDIGAGHTVTALYEIIPAGSSEKIGDVDELEYQKTEVVKSANMMTLKLRYKAPDEDVSKLMIHKVKEDDIFTESTSQNFTFASSIAQFGLLLRDSEYKANSSWESALNLAREAKGEDKFGLRSEYIRLIQIAEALDE